MKTIYLYFSALLLVLASCQSLMAQDELLIDSLAKTGKKNTLKGSINFISNNVFYGRADTTTTPIVIPQLKVTFKNGMYISSSFYFLPSNTTQKVDGGNLVAGYNFDLTDNLSGSTSFTKLFYNSKSTEIGSSISSTLSAGLDYDINSIITPSLQVEYSFIKNGFSDDLVINGGLSHDFSKVGLWGSNDIGVISPTIEVNAGTQNFYDSYLVTKKYKITAKNLAKYPSVAKLLNKLNKFNLLDYEFSIPVVYKSGPLILTFNPTYAITLNSLPPAISKYTPPLNSNLFYFTLGAIYKF